MNDWKKWVMVAGGVAAVAGHWLPGYWLDVIGGAVVVVVALMPE
jgi:hypothetical protein|tara:strand:- start:434 stop:565 length:132 start_codon:yes stop_codon:yes gene_type:complete